LLNEKFILSNDRDFRKRNKTNCFVLFAPYVGDISDDVSREEFLRAISDEIIGDANPLRGLT